MTPEINDWITLYDWLDRDCFDCWYYPLSGAMKLSIVIAVPFVFIVLFCHRHKRPPGWEIPVINLGIWGLKSPKYFRYYWVYIIIVLYLFNDAVQLAWEKYHREAPPPLFITQQERIKEVGSCIEGVFLGHEWHPKVDSNYKPDIAMIFDGNRKLVFTIEKSNGYCSGKRWATIEIGDKSLEYFGQKTGHYARICYVKDVVKDFRADNPYKNLCFYEVKIKKNEDLPEGKN